jgi:hypothetical protein
MPAGSYCANKFVTTVIFHKACYFPKEVFNAQSFINSARQIVFKIC